MPATHLFLILIPMAYLIGSIPFGLLVGFAKGIDVRAGGSGNIGATNVGRQLGKKYFFYVFFLDMLKSLVPMAIASAVVHHFWADPRDVPLYIYVLWLCVGFAAVMGHMFSVFLKFKGGKGVATSAGVMLGLWPYFTLPGFLAILVFIVVFFATRYVSLGSMIGACSFPIFYTIVGTLRGWSPLHKQLPLLLFSILIAAMIVYKHRTNIQRLLAGTENRFVKKPTV
ncbi:MAG TPA: glycerol-3-phosphate 1-O-acyltransferase PlsY [Tepidisphaeraceae bacterium]|jgi:glycerol-3-phosphate acyltransferase PlsY|nr:glycerol-3-phosphate 1-O-acyltransferase PlsY [Tepidisphaeraceae bacterium]